MQRVIFSCVAIFSLVALYIALSRSGFTNFLEDGAAVRQWILDLGLFGPLIVILLMTTAIIVSPIPSAPIALAAGAAYGHYAGTVYVAIGSETGAIIAFYIARYMGHDIVNKWLGEKYKHTMVGSQNALMLIVFISRLLPFLSFDIISYAAGVTPIKFWRFAVATLAGIIPASFLLAHFGSELVSLNSNSLYITAGVIGFFGLLPFVIKRFKSKLK